MKLIEYIPLFLREIKEFKLITEEEEKELDKIKSNINQMLDEVIVADAKEYGLKRYEKIYNIDNTATDLATRRFNILSKINNRVPYTLNWLRNKLNNTIGKDNYILNMDYDKQILKIEILALFKDIATILYKDLKEQLPANLQITVNLFQTEECQCYLAGIVHTGEYIEIRQVV